MEIEVNIPNSECNGFNTHKFSFSLNDTILDIKKKLKSERNNESKEEESDGEEEKEIFLCDISSGLIFEDEHINVTDIVNGRELDRLQLTVLRKLSSKRVKNEAHVEQRRQSRIMIVKSKISSEIQRETRKMIEYIEDSPFFWSAVSECENRIKRLSLRLQNLCDMILDLCSVTITFSEHCMRISNLVCKSWEDIEAGYSTDIISLSSIFNELGEQFLHMSHSSRQLAVTLKAVLVDAFRDFNAHTLSKVQSHSKQLQSVQKEYEGSLRKLLHSPQTETMVKHKTKQYTLSEWEQRCVDLQQKYELLRYDHCNILNAVINRHRYELILNLCACFSGFETFFHVGYEASLSHKVFHRSIQMGIAQKTLSQDRNDSRLAEVRQSIAVRGHTQRNLKNNESDYYSGFLYKQSSNMKKDWKRRWFVLENGELGYYRSRDKLEREFVVNAMLCKVRERTEHDYRYVFELISPSRRVYVLQAQCDRDYREWCDILRKQVNRVIYTRSHYHDESKDSDESNNDTLEKEKEQLKEAIQSQNETCADCRKSKPQWVAINIGICICIDCAGIHRGLGTHISKVRSLALDDINASILTLFTLLGNDKINSILEHSIPSDYESIDCESSTTDKEKYIKGKYMFKMFVDPTQSKELTHEQINEQLWTGAGSNDIALIFEALCYGANIDHQFKSYEMKTALHQTALQSHIEATEFLLQNGAAQTIHDSNQKLAREFAENKSDDRLLKILDTHSCVAY